MKQAECQEAFGRVEGRTADQMGKRAVGMRV